MALDIRISYRIRLFGLLNILLKCLSFIKGVFWPSTNTCLTRPLVSTSKQLERIIAFMHACSISKSCDSWTIVSRHCSQEHFWANTKRVHVLFGDNLPIALLGWKDNTPCADWDLERNILSRDGRVKQMTFACKPSRGGFNFPLVSVRHLNAEPCARPLSSAKYVMHIYEFPSVNSVFIKVAHLQVAYA